VRLRKPRIPEADLGALGLNPRERVLAWTTDPEGRYLVATESDLILQRHPPDYTRIGWEQVEQASFKDGSLIVDVAEGNDLDATTRLTIPAGSDIELPIVVRDRVTASIAVNEHVPLQGEHGVRVVARRRAAEGRLRWGYRTDPQLVRTPELRTEAEEAVTRVRAELGLG
jgi:hypothetical protein